jgi:RNA polymerase sigma-70 factor (ECF subfamily)
VIHAIMAGVMDEAGADAFEAHRAMLLGIAYRMLGSRAEAEDVVQDAFLRWRSAPRAEVRSDRAYLATVVTRLCLDQLKTARARRETYVGPWLPEPVRTDAPTDTESISLAFLVLLESLTPIERAVYLLCEVFDHSHAEAAEIVGRDEAACRQLLHRARAHVAARRPRFAPSQDAHRRLLVGFAAACAAGDLAGLRRLLAEDVSAWADGGGKAFAARRVVRGADAVARYYLGVTARAPRGSTLEVAEVNGWPALLARVAGRLASVIALETDGERVYAIRAIVNPDKLALAALA